jgi:hypothetical protein
VSRIETSRTGIFEDFSVPKKSDNANSPVDVFVKTFGGEIRVHRTVGLGRRGIEFLGGHGFDM